MLWCARSTFNRIDTNDFFGIKKLHETTWDRPIKKAKMWSKGKGVQTHSQFKTRILRLEL
jgi:hypothetical protein